MCRVCEAIGGVKPWYLNEDLYGRRIYKRKIGPPTAYDIHSALDEGMDFGSWGLIEDVVRTSWSAPEEEHLEKLNKINNEYFAVREFCPIMPLEDAKKIMDLTWPLAIMHCMCRKNLTGTEERCGAEYSCMALGNGMYKWERWPERQRGGVQFVTPEEGKEWLDKWTKKGFVAIGMMYGPDNWIGGICMCDYPQCLAVKFNLDYDIKYCMKAHYVAQVDPEKCKGCNLCIGRCQFGCITKDSKRETVKIQMMDCTGCGLCRDVCQQDAIELKWRESFPALKDNWLITGRRGGARPAPNIEIDFTKCQTPLECARCMKLCPQYVFYLREAKMVKLREAFPEEYQGCLTPWFADRCVLCGKCVEECPAGAITITTKDGMCFTKEGITDAPQTGERA